MPSTTESQADFGTLATVSGFLKTFSPPKGAFDPHGSWKQSWLVWLTVMQPAECGFLEIQRERSGSDVNLAVESAIVEMNGAFQMKARLVCAADELCTPRSWEVETVLLDGAGQVVPETRFRETAVVKGKLIERMRGARRRTTPAPSRFSTNWGVFDAVQRLPRRAAAPLAFTLFEDLDLAKPNQRLQYLEQVSAPAPLSVYQQIGEGVLPFHYWVDAQGRMLFAISGFRAHLYDPEARRKMQTMSGNKRRTV